MGYDTTYSIELTEDQITVALAAVRVVIKSLDTSDKRLGDLMIVEKKMLNKLLIINQ